jgi:hypothetical protein
MKPMNIKERKKLFVKEISSEKVFKEFGEFKEKREIRTGVPIPECYVRVIVLKDYEGMRDYLLEGDIIDLPERRFKTLSFRGLVKEYKGDLCPVNKR